MRRNVLFFKKKRKRRLEGKKKKRRDGVGQVVGVTLEWAA